MASLAPAPLLARMLLRQPACLPAFSPARGPPSFAPLAGYVIRVVSSDPQRHATLSKRLKAIQLRSSLYFAVGLRLFFAFGPFILYILGTSHLIVHIEALGLPCPGFAGLFSCHGCVAFARYDVLRRELLLTLACRAHRTAHRCRAGRGGTISVRLRASGRGVRGRRGGRGEGGDVGSFDTDGRSQLAQLLRLLFDARLDTDGRRKLTCGCAVCCC